MLSLANTAAWGAGTGWITSKGSQYRVAHTREQVTARAAPARQVRTSSVDAGGHRLHVECVGTGTPTVLFEAGLGGNAREWRTIANAIGGHTTACLYDRAGYGQSESGAPPRDAETLAGELAKVIDQAQIRAPLIFVAHSFGGLIVRTLAERLPEDTTTALVLLDTSHEHQFTRLEAGTGPPALAPARGSPFKLSAAPGRTAGAAPEEAEAIAQGARQPKSRVAAYQEMASMRASADQLAKRLAATTRARPHAIVMARTRKLRAGWMALQDALARDHGAPRAIQVEGAGHWIHLDAAEIVTATIAALVACARNDCDRTGERAR